MPVKLIPPKGDPAPIQIGFAGVDFKPAKDGTFTVPDNVAEELRRRGWTDASVSTNDASAASEA